MVPNSLMVRTVDVVNGNLWRCFPVINCDRTKDIPCDYPGPIGVPISAMSKIGRNDGHSGFLVLDIIKPRMADGRELYRRIIIRNLYPDLPEEIDLAAWFRLMGVPIEVEFIRNMSELPPDATVAYRRTAGKDGPMGPQ